MNALLGQAGTPSREMVKAAYQVLLGRQPESESIIQSFMAQSCKRLLTTIVYSNEYKSSLDRNALYHYNSALNCEQIILNHAQEGLSPHPNLCVNFLGVKIDPRILPEILGSMVNQVERVPIPGNWHADIAEWAAALRAVDLSCNTFSMLELGCGWGCWMVNTGIAAKKAGLTIHVSGIEADEGHIAFAADTCRRNGLSNEEFALLRGVASEKPGMAFFPVQKVPGASWGNEPIFNIDGDEARRLQESGDYDCLPNISLSSVIENQSRLDLLHIDIQGGEADFIDTAISLVNESVNYLVIGTHSREIEGRLFKTLLANDWQLEIERPAIINVTDVPFPQIDGVQGWRNKRMKGQSKIERPQERQSSSVNE